MTKYSTKTATTVAEWKTVAERNEIALTMEEIRERVCEVLDGKTPAMFVFGGSGVGKTHIVREELAKRGHVGDMITPKDANALLDEFLNATFDKDQMRDRSNPLPMVFDEARLLFTTPANLLVMKLATDNAKGSQHYHTGHIWHTFEDYEKQNGEPGKRKIRHIGTSLRAPIIAMTNTNLREFSKDIRADALAMTSRAPPILVPEDPLATWEYVVYLALNTLLLNEYKGQTVPLATRSAAIEYFTANAFQLQQVSVRYLLNILEIYILASPALLNRRLAGLLLSPEEVANRNAKLPQYDQPNPRQQDWAELRKAMTPRLSTAPAPKPRRNRIKATATTSTKATNPPAVVSTPNAFATCAALLSSFLTTEGQTSAALLNELRGCGWDGPADIAESSLAALVLSGLALHMNDGAATTYTRA